MAGAEAGAVARVRLTLFADLKRFLPKGQSGPLTFDLRTGDTVGTLVARADIPASEEITVSLNGKQAGRDSILNDGDEVILFSPMEGG